MATPKRATASGSVTQSTIMPPADGRDGRPPLAAVDAWHSAMAEWQRAMIGLLLARLERDRIMVHDALASHSWADAVMIHAQWMEGMVQDYNSQMAQMLTTVSRHNAWGCVTWHPAAWANCPLEDAEAPALELWQERTRELFRPYVR